MESAVLCIRNGDLQGLISLLSNGKLSPISRDKYGRSLLYWAVHLGKFNIVQAIVMEDNIKEIEYETLQFLLHCKGGKKYGLIH